MHRIATILLFFSLLFAGNVLAQERADELVKQADEHLSKREYIKARFNYLQAYRAYLAKNNISQAVECGINVVSLYHRELLYKEAYEVLSDISKHIDEAEKASGKPLPELRFLVTRERLRMSIKQKNKANAEKHVENLAVNARAANNDSINRELLISQTDYYYTFGMTTKGDAALNQLVSQFVQIGDHEQARQCYKTVIGIARKAGNAALVERTYDKYILWNDSVNALEMQDRLNALKLKFDESLDTIQEKETSLATRQYIIVGLCALSAILAALLVIGIIVLLRFILLTRKQKKAIAVANEHNELKSHFIRHISDQMEPTLATLPQELPGVKALHSFSAHIQEMSDLELTLTETYELEECNMSTFCEAVMDKVRGHTQADVSLTVNAPKLSVKVSPEPLEQVLVHLLLNAAEHTPAEGKIWLDFKKRGAHTQQFIVSDTGPGIPEEKRDTLFKPFAEVKNLTEGDGLGLPICSLKATKMNGTLTLDTAYTKGARFVLELHM